MAKDYYETLGVSKSDSGDAIRKAYRQLAMRYHPDRNPNDQDAADKFREISEAYEVLRDEEKRKHYDLYGHAPDAMRGGRQGGFDFDFTNGFAGIFEEMFGNDMGMAGRGRHARHSSRRGEDLRYDLDMTLAECFQGLSRQIRVNAPTVCEPCRGSGAEGGKKVECPTCHGSGMLRAQRGFFSVQRSCHRCHGEGYISHRICGSCHGSGRVMKERILRVDIPVGVDDATRIRLQGKGASGMNGGAAGDLYIFVRVKQGDAPFHRKGHDLFYTHRLSMAEAALGCQIALRGIDGRDLSLAIPAGTQPQQRFRLRQEGMRHIGDQKKRGDLIVTVDVAIPKHLSKEQKDALHRLFR